MSTQPTAAARRRDARAPAFYERISRQHLTPLWLSLANLVTPRAGRAPASRRRGRSPTSAPR